MTKDSILAAILFLVGPKRAESEAARLSNVAEDIAVASEAPPIFPGANNAMLLLSVGLLEGGLREDVITCRIRGDKHLTPEGSITTYQLLGEASRKGHSVQELCSSNLLASQVALEVLRDKFARCKTQQGMFNSYNTGRCNQQTYMSKRAGELYRRLVSVR